MMSYYFFFFFKQKTAYELRISDWSSDVCSSDLRGRVTKPLNMGVRAINGLLTVGEGQRVAIVAGSGVGKSVLMGQMIAGTECDVIVVGLIGERSREVRDFVETKLPPPVRKKSVDFAVPAETGRAPGRERGGQNV